MWYSTRSDGRNHRATRACHEVPDFVVRHRDRGSEIVTHPVRLPYRFVSENDRGLISALHFCGLHDNTIIGVAVSRSNLLSFRFVILSRMLIDGSLEFDATNMGFRARQLEEEGFDGAWAPETGHDPFSILSAAAMSTTKLELGTGILVAFGRSPMITATMANDLQLISSGRLLLGLGSQIKPHIEKRYSMPWSHPAQRMREYILAMRAIWASWNEGAALAFRGEFYRHTLMTPFFSPRPHEYGPPKVFLAAVGGLMTEVAGEVADGLLVHPFTTERYLREITLPALDRGLAKAGRSRSAFQVAFTGMVVAGKTVSEQAKSDFEVRKQIGFYGSTPAYRAVLDVHGWGALQTQLSDLARNGEWDAMAHLIGDDVLDAFSIVAPLGEVAGRVCERFGDLIDRFSLYQIHSLGDEAARDILREFKDPPTRA